jgi:hypothetical protein
MSSKSGALWFHVRPRSRTRLAARRHPLEVARFVGSRSRRRPWLALCSPGSGMSLVALAGLVAGLMLGLPAASEAAAPPPVTQVCGQPILNSPYNYDGKAGAYVSGTPGLPTYGTPGSAFPQDDAGRVLPQGKHEYLSYELEPDTVYYLLPGKHVGAIQADTNDAFVGGLAGETASVLSGAYSGKHWGIDSNSTNGDQSGVTIEYLTIEKYMPYADQGAVNPDANTGWKIIDDTVTRNVPGAGIIAGTENTLEDDCLTLNGQYGFQSEDTNGFGSDSLTEGPYDLTVKGNEISYNDTCDLEGLVNNPAIGWTNYDPVPKRYRNANCGEVAGDGNEGGFKLWHTNGVTVEGNYIHNNWGPGVWADTDNANTTVANNTITDNDGEGIIEEISYNFSITNNYIEGNAVVGGLGNSGFPSPAIYISESGSDGTFGGVPACAESSCADQGAYPTESVVSGNTLVNNGGNIFLWQNSERFCSDGFDGACTLVDGGPAGPFSISACEAELPTAAFDPSTYAGEDTGSPSEDWWDGCLWHTSNVSVTHNTIDFNPAEVKDCKPADWSDCGAGGIFSEYGSPPNDGPGWVVATQLTFHQNDKWADNTYNGPSTFYAWNQGNGENPVSWAAWTGSTAEGDECSSAGERQSGYCVGPFGQDAGSIYNATPFGKTVRKG